MNINEWILIHLSSTIIGRKEKDFTTCTCFLYLTTAHAKPTGFSRDSGSKKHVFYCK